MFSGRTSSSVLASFFLFAICTTSCRARERSSTPITPVVAETPSAPTSASVAPTSNLSPGERILAVADEPPLLLASDGDHLYVRTASAIAAVPKSGGAIEPLAAAPDGYGASTLAVDASGVFWTTNENHLATAVGWRASVWRVSKTGGDAKELVTVSENPRSIALDATTVYFTSGDYSYDASGLHGVGGVRAIDKSTGKRVDLANDMGATSVAIDASFVYWTSVVPNDGMILAGGLYRVPKAGGAKKRIPLKMEGAVQFPNEVAVHAGRLYFEHAFEMTSRSCLCFAPMSGGTADCCLEQPRGRLEAYRFDGDDVWFAVAPLEVSDDIDALGTSHAFHIAVTSLTSRSSKASVSLRAVGGFAVDDTNVYWSSGKEIHARTKASIMSAR